MKLVDDARDWPKWNSVHVAAVISALPWAWSQLPAEFKAVVPDWAMLPIGGALFVAFVVARVRQQ